MKDLITRLEQASEGNRELDMEIQRPLEVAKHPDAVFVDEDGQVWFADVYEDGEPASWTYADPPHYTTSIDAALTLVPEKLTNRTFMETCIPAKAGFRKNGKAVLYFEAATPALALCIAALKARMSDMQEPCNMCKGTGVIDHPISGETHGPDVDALRRGWAQNNPIPCPACASLKARK